jgi:transposase
MMGWQTGDQRQLFYLFNLERRIPASHLLRRINPIVMQVLADLREKLAPFYSDIGRPSIDPELMIRMLIVGYCYGIRFERRLCEEVELHLAYRWFCRLDLDDKVPDHSTFSVNRQGRFRDSNILRHVFEAVVRACMNAGLVKGEGFAIDASVIEANASRYHGKAPDEIDWLAPERQTHAVVEFLAAFDDEDSDADRKVPKVVSPVDPSSAWTAKANKRVQFGYGLNYLIDLGPHAVIVDVEGTPARTYDEVAATKTMINRTEETFGLKLKRLAADTAYGTGKLLAWLLEKRGDRIRIVLLRLLTAACGTFVWTGRALQAGYDDLEMVGLALLYPALEWSVSAPGHHGYPRTSDLILRKALNGRWCHQITDATARPFLHFFNPTRRPRQVSLLLC